MRRQESRVQRVALAYETSWNAVFGLPATMESAAVVIERGDTVLVKAIELLPPAQNPFFD